VNQKEVWRVPIEDNGQGGRRRAATAGGLVFSGDSKKDEVAAYRADTGELLWSSPARRVWSPRLRLRAGCEQYVAWSPAFVCRETTGHRTIRACWSTSSVAQRVYRKQSPLRRPVESAAGFARRKSSRTASSCTGGSAARATASMD